MAFSKNYIGRVSSSANTDALKVWTYNATAAGNNEAIATVVASAYFNSFQQSLAAATLSGPLAVGDVMHVHGNDANGMYVVTSITTNVTLATYAAIGSISSAQVNPNLIQYASVAITAANFNGMYAAPHLLLAAGGANTIHVLDKIRIVMTYGAAAFAGGGVAAVQFDSTANGAGVIASSTLAAAAFQDTASTVWSMNAGVVDAPFSTCANKGLYLSNITGAFTTGDSDSVVHLWYKTIATV